jgi:peptidoglycan hydrolase CwlO-like protein
MKTFSKINIFIIFLLVIAPFALLNIRVVAQEDADSSSDGEINVEETTGGEPAEAPAQADQESLIAEREALEKELAELEKQIAAYEGNISENQKERKTLQNQITLLQNEIKKLDLQIQQNNAMVRDLTLQVKDTSLSIGKTEDKIGNLKTRILEILQTIYEKDQETPIEILFSGQRLSDFFEEVVWLSSLHAKNHEFLTSIKTLKTTLEDQKKSLDEEKDGLEKLLQIQLLQKQESQQTKKQQEVILEKTKGEETAYQNLLVQTKKRAQEIRARIFELIGVDRAPTFGEALELARYAEKAIGIRPAFLLAVLTQESNIGKNVGQCYLPKDENENIKRRIMAPGAPSSKRNDVAYFLDVCGDLGRDPYNTPVSCPMQYGWGGAMGPAQFIPATWADPNSSPNGVSYKERVKELNGGKAADPWDIKDAFLAAALYLADYGAKAKTESKEWRAAMIYFSGSTNAKYRFYGDSVMNIAEQYEEDIAALESGNGNGVNE